MMPLHKGKVAPAGDELAMGFPYKLFGLNYRPAGKRLEHQTRRNQRLDAQIA